MQEFSWKYNQIERNSRNYRKRKNQAIAQLLTQYSGIRQSSFADLLLFLNSVKESQITVNMLIFAQIIYPILEREIEAGNLQAIKVMLQHTTLLNNYNKLQKKYDRYTDTRLIHRYLAQDPNDYEVLLLNEANLRRFFSHTVHELPSGVLYAMDGASVEECQELLKSLEDYKNTCQKLQIDRNDDIVYYSRHYQGYQDYLQHRQNYENYADYMQKHNLER